MNINGINAPYNKDDYPNLSDFEIEQLNIMYCQAVNIGELNYGLHQIKELLKQNNDKG